MRKFLFVVGLLLLVACATEDVATPASVWCAKLVECGAPADATRVQIWCEEQFAPTAEAQTSEACLSAVERASCEVFDTAMPLACQ